MKQGKDVFLKSFDKKYITFNKRVEEKIEAMRKFKPYNFKKFYLAQSIFEDDNEETKIGYLNINGYLESNHAKYIDNHLNLLNLDFLVLSETWLTEKNTNEEIIRKLDNWKIIKRLDATDNRKHMGLMLMVPKRNTNFMTLVFIMDYAEGYTKDNPKLLYQGLIVNLKKHYKKLVFLYVRKTPTLIETKEIARRFANFDCIIGDLNLNPASEEQKQKLSIICGTTKYMALLETTTINLNQLDHIILEKDLSAHSFTTAYNNFSSDHKSIVLRLATNQTSFLKEFKEKINFAAHKHLKSTKEKQSEYKSKKYPDDSTNCMNMAFIEPTAEEESEDESSQSYVISNTREESEQTLETISSNLILYKFNNPPMRNLCFSNVVVTCLFNVPILRAYLQEEGVAHKESRSIIEELLNLTRDKTDKVRSTQRLRTIVTSKCLEAGQISQKFNNNMQFDCVEFLESLLEHFWKESTVPDTLNESVFGGLFQENFYCAECENIEKHPIQRLPDVISVCIEGETVQTSIYSHFSRELIEKKCLKCYLIIKFCSVCLFVCNQKSRISRVSFRAKRETM